MVAGPAFPPSSPLSNRNTMAAMKWSDVDAGLVDGAPGRHGPITDGTPNVNRSEAGGMMEIFTDEAWRPGCWQGSSEWFACRAGIPL